MPIDELSKFILNTFCEDYKITEKELFSNNQMHFRFLCYKNNFFLKHFELPFIKKNSIYEAVLIEFRILPHIEFLVRNAILKLGKDWSFTIVCGNLNYDVIQNMALNISDRITVIKFDIDNLTPSQYNDFMTTLPFWEKLTGEKILIYQEDSIIFKNGINDFLKWDFIGAPFARYANDTPNSVGNGGFSLRTRTLMIDIIKKYPINSCYFNESTTKYMKKNELIVPPEDIYFSKTIQEFELGNVADWDSAFKFSSESIVNKNSLAGHKFWVTDTTWKERVNNLYNLSLYEASSNLKQYLNYYKLPTNFNKTTLIKNAFDIDFYFMSKANNYTYENTNDLLKNVTNVNILDGIIYHPKQLKNIYPGIDFYHFNSNVFVSYKTGVYILRDFVKKFVYGLSYKNICNILIKKKYYNLNNNINLLILIFIGNEKRGLDIINKLLYYKSIEKFNVAFCFNSHDLLVSPSLKSIIKENFENYAIYVSREMGTDITPTLLMYQNILNTGYEGEHIIKLHTKSQTAPYVELTEYLLSKSLKELLTDKDKLCNCIGHPSYYMDLYEDTYNNLLKINHSKKIMSENYFVAGTIFYIPTKIMNAVVKFIENNNYQSYYFNNLYENNSINKNYSPIHFIERLFGVIKI
jgi:hypothetical protein